ncbi:MAG: hypothetical protein IPM29_19405 [Planctomycetes bacterium]|nr:hypothetical protein [Planctomycetota bacterium]
MTRRSSSPRRPERGLALIAVLVALAVLLAMAGPFVFSMGRGDEAARASLEELRAEWGSASARDVLLQRAAEGCFMYDQTRASDGRAEFPASLELPGQLAEVGQGGLGRTLLQGEVEDVQRTLDLDTATPLALANLLDLAVRTTDEVALEDSEIPVDGALDAFGETGYLLIDREVIAYDARDGSRFRGLRRGQLAEFGYFPAELAPDYVIPADSLVLDLRCVLAVLFPHEGDGVPMTRTPYGSVSEVQRIELLGLPGFSAQQLETLERYCTTVSMRENSARFGHAERVFLIREDPLQHLPRILQVRSGAGIGAGRIVRIRSLDGVLVEYGLVAATYLGGNAAGINLPNDVAISLLHPLSQPFEPLETIVEPLVPVAVNLNTAEEPVLRAVFAHLRANVPSVVRDGETQRRPPYVSTRRAEELARAVIAMRGDLGSELPAELGRDGELDLTPRPFDGWEDFVRRFMPLLWGDGVDSQALRVLAMRVYEGLQVGCTDRVQMGTVPIAFFSSPLVHYRASAARLLASGREVARHEREGEAIALPGGRLGWGAATQEMVEEFLRLDRHSPYWLTGPINTSAVRPDRLGTVPALRTEAHLLAEVFPNAGFGQPRFPDKSGDDGYVQPLPSTTPFAYGGNVAVHESFLNAQNPEGRDLQREGDYRIANIGERATPGAAEAMRNRRSHDRIAFPLTTVSGITERHAVTFWFRPRDVGQQVLFDLSNPADDAGPDRNRIKVEIREQKLVFEVIAEAGIDPQPSASLAAVERSTGRFEVPLSDYDLQPDTWYHVAFSAHGDRPGQLSFLVDGVPRGRPAMQTELVDALPAYRPEDGVVSFLLDRDRYPDVRVASTAGFPQRGVLRIGNELFEYSSKDDSTFYTRFAGSLGGRQARAWIYEFLEPIPSNIDRDLLEELRQISQQGSEPLEITAPDHPVGAGVELYGYSLPLWPHREYPLMLSGGSLADELGTYGVARVVNTQDLEPIIITAGNTQRLVGRGLDETWSGDLQLGNPLSDDLPADDASNEIAAAFPASGGYALLVQRWVGNTLQARRPGGAGNEVGETVFVGGIQAIEYTARQGTRLTGVTRGVVLPKRTGLEGDLRRDPTRRRSFVIEWSPQYVSRDGRVSFNELPRMYTYVVPISINVNGVVDDATELTQWLQIRSGAGDDRETEWVRYNATRGARVVRVDRNAYEATRRNLVGDGDVSVVIFESEITIAGLDNQDELREPYPAPVDTGYDGIGYLDRLELDYPACSVVRRAMKFRGDDFSDVMRTSQGLRAPRAATSSHAHPAGSQVLPVHRFEYDYGGYGLTAPRPGRLDRVTMVQGSRRLAGETPAVEWHTVNWTVPVRRSDQIDPDATRAQLADEGVDRFGPEPCYLVGLQDVLRTPYLAWPDGSRTGDAGRDLFDVRLLDRMVKFPSGELPAVDTDEAVVGGTGLGDGRQARGIVDEVAVVARMAFPRPLDSQLPEDGQEFFVRTAVIVTPAGALEGGRPLQLRSYGNNDVFPQNGGLLQIDRELLVYQSFDPGSGRVQIAPGGRGVLGTQPSGHDEGALAHFLEHVPAAVLASGCGLSDHEFETNGLGGLPRHGGTVLMGQELLHYTWTRGDTTLAMPLWQSRSAEGRARVGLFRGRYGTQPSAGSSGTPVIWFPFRYWDRYRPEADDPESAYLQVTLDHGPAFFGGVAWEADLPDATVDLYCYARLDERGSFDNDPAQTPGLWLLREGQPGGQPNAIRSHGRHLELRFVNVYEPGAFDPTLFLAQGYKRTPRLRWFFVDYEGEPRILDERVTAR